LSAVVKSSDCNFISPSFKPENTIIYY